MMVQIPYWDGLVFPWTSDDMVYWKANGLEIETYCKEEVG